MRNLDLIPLPSRLPVTKVQRVTFAVDALADDRVRQAALLQVLLRRDMGLHDRGLTVACEHETCVVHMLDTGTLRRVDGRLVAVHAHFIRDARVRDDEQLVSASKGSIECRRLAVVALAHLNTGRLDLVGRTRRIVQRDDDVTRCEGEDMFVRGA